MSNETVGTSSVRVAALVRPPSIAAPTPAHTPTPMPVNDTDERKRDEITWISPATGPRRGRDGERCNQGEKTNGAHSTCKRRVPGAIPAVGRVADPRRCTLASVLVVVRVAG